METENIVCQMCGSPAPKRGPGPQKYCEPCSEIADKKRKHDWARKNYRWTDEKRLKINESKRKKREIIAIKSSEGAKSICWIPDTTHDSEFIITKRIAIPWTSALLKNHSWAFSRNKGHVFLRKETKDAQESLIKLFLPMRGQFKNNKIWLDLFVQKPSQRSGDSINYIDRVADAIKVAIGIDDRWFCIRRLDWEIVKQDPQIFIGISQIQCEDSQACSYCGKILPYSFFNKNKSMKLGISRECRNCSSAIVKKEKSSE